MERLKLIVCENYYPEVRQALDLEGLTDIEVSSFPSFCDGGFSPDEIAGNSLFSLEPGIQKILLCSSMCRIPHAGTGDSPFRYIRETSFCYTHLVGDNYARFFSEEGYYVLTAGWLDAWQLKLSRQGFSRETAREFYQGWCRKLVFLDAGFDKKAGVKLEALSEYLEIPSKMIPITLDSLRAEIKEIVTRWELSLSKGQQNDGSQIRELKELAAKNTAVLNIMSQIAVAEFKRDVISKLEEVWLVIFGANRVVFWPADQRDAGDTPLNADLEATPGKSFYLDGKTKTLYAKLESGGRRFGILEVGDFLFPDHIEKYLDLIDSIIKIAALAVSNAQRYEDLTASRNRYEYSSYHDGLTGVYNRSYYKKLRSDLSSFPSGGAFAIDLDGLKKVNDSLGHAAGDELIQAAGEVLKQTFRESDDIIRMGGDEFTVVVKDVDEFLMERLSDRLLHNLEEASRQGTGPVLRLSFGYSLSQDARDSLESVVQRADYLMYQNKRRRKGDEPLD